MKIFQFIHKMVNVSFSGCTWNVPKWTILTCYYYKTVSRTMFSFIFIIFMHTFFIFFSFKSFIRVIKHVERIRCWNSECKKHWYRIIVPLNQHTSILFLITYTDWPLIPYIWIVMKTCLFAYIENFTTKNWKFSDKNSDIFHISAQNFDC